MREKIKVRKYHRPLNPTHLSVVCLVFEIITVHFLHSFVSPSSLAFYFRATALPDYLFSTINSCIHRGKERLIGDIEIIYCLTS